MTDRNAEQAAGVSGVWVYGASDDLIEVEGDIREEFALSGGDNDRRLLAFSNGVVLSITYGPGGIWRITPVVGEIEVKQAPERDDDSYTDRAFVRGEITWVVYGTEMAGRGR